MKKDLNLDRLFERKAKAESSKPTFTQVLSTTKSSQVGRPKSTEPRVSYGVGLRRSEVERIKAQANRLNVTPNALTAFVIRDGLKRLEAGKLKVPVEKQADKIAD
jgi:hypothetical protein